MPEKRHCYHVAAYHILICDLDITPSSELLIIDLVRVDDDGDADDAFLDSEGII